jgi:hypothetical protein
MRKTKPIKEAKLIALEQRLDGGSCLNQRSILLACEVFGGNAPAGAGLRLADLLEALWVLELMIVSKSVSYDGTLPAKDLADLDRATTTLVEGTQCRDGIFRAIRPRDEKEQLGFAKGAALKALDDVGVLQQSSGSARPAANILPGLDQPLDPESADEFFDNVSRFARASERAEGREGVSLDELMSLLAGSFRGSKCVAGIAALGSQAIHSAVRIPSLWNISPELAAGILINRFRFAYVRQLSFGAHNIYVPAGRWKPLSAMHAITFAEAVRRHFQHSYAGVITEQISQRLEKELGGRDRNFTIALPPIGLYVLMKANPKHGPKGIIDSALDTFKDYGQLFRQFWKKTCEVDPPENGWTVMTGNNGLDTVSESIERLLSDELGKLEKTALHPGYQNSSLLERYVTPIVKAGSQIGGAVLGTIAGAQAGIGPVLGAVAGGAVGWAIDQCYAVFRGRLVGHIDEYRALDEALLRAYSGQIRLDKLEQKVSEVLKRQLI